MLANIITSLNLEEYKQNLDNALDAELAIQNEHLALTRESISELKKSGYGIYPILITNQGYGFAEYPELTFKVPSHQSVDRFRNQEAIELFGNGQFVKGSVLHLNEREGKIRLYTDEFPDWLDDGSVGIRVGVDDKSITLAKKSLQTLTENHVIAGYLFEQKKLQGNHTNFEFSTSSQLNDSQNDAVKHMLSDERVTILHGPPGTGKTTTLVEGIKQIVQQGQKVIAVAPSNAAVDHLAASLLKKGVKILRVGNLVKMNEDLLAQTIDGRLAQGVVFQELKKMKIQAEDFRKLASQYKRNFGREEKEQRKLIWAHYKSLKKEIQNTIQFYKEKWQEEAQVICGTPVSLRDEIAQIPDVTVVIDEAGQCLQPLAWMVIPENCTKLILAGDHLQLPPTVLSPKAEKLGLNQSILDVFLEKFPTNLLDTQYRMKSDIVAFSNQFFYESKLKTPAYLDATDVNVLFYDTAGTGFEEERGEEGSSWYNSGELGAISNLMEQLNLVASDTVLISPYSGQVAAARTQEIPFSRIATIDSFQGQEYKNVIVSLVRSNDKGEIGFLKDRRRMNVAITRAQEKLILIGDSATLASDTMFKELFDFIEQQGGYRSAWELM